MQALILAAGKGSRLYQVSEGTPKPLLQIGQRHLIEHQLEMLSDAGIGPVGLVVGYCDSEIREIVGRQAEYIQNPRWTTTNSLYSFWLAREWVKEDLMVLNCDILLHPDIINRLLSAKGDAFAYDSSSGTGREQMKVKLRDGKLIDMGKELPPNQASGENVGILRFTADSVQTLFDEADGMIKAGEEKSWLGAAVRNVARKIEFHGVDIAGLPWAEIDFPYDLERARKEVWPAIKGAAWKRKIRWPITRWALVLFSVLVISPTLVKGLFPPQGADWDTVDLSGGKKTKIALGERKQKWWLLKRDNFVEFEGEGPNTLRIETRLILDKPFIDEVPYVLEIILDGKQVNWFKMTAKPSKTAKYKDLTLGKKERFKFKLPEGLHPLSVKLVATEGSRCMIRLREVETDPETE